MKLFFVALAVCLAVLSSMAGGQQRRDRTAVLGQEGSRVQIHGPSETVMRVNGKTELLCQVYVMDKGMKRRPINEPYNVTWYFMPENSTEKRVVLTFINTGTTNYTLSTNGSKYQSTQKSAVGLRIMHGNLSDAGLYTCHLEEEGEDPVGYGAHVMVLDSPSCYNEEKDVDYNQTFTLQCLVRYRGYQPPSVYWLHGSTTFNSTREVVNDTFLNETLTMRANEHMKYEGYDCVVHYFAVYQVKCQSYPLIKVYRPPKIVQILVTPVYDYNDTRVPLGKRVQLQCMAEGYPYPIYSFSFRPWSNNSSQRELDNYNQNKSFHIIESFQSEDQGTYICFAMNNIRDRPHYDSKNVTLLLQEKPEKDRVELP